MSINRKQFNVSHKILSKYQFKKTPIKKGGFFDRKFNKMSKNDKN